MKEKFTQKINQLRFQKIKKNLSKKIYSLNKNYWRAINQFKKNPTTSYKKLKFFSKKIMSNQLMCLNLKNKI